MLKKKSVKSKKRQNNLGNGDSYLAPLRRGFAFVSTKAVLVRKRIQTFGTHKSKAPSGRELPTNSGEGERVAI